jgi:hypothetical protein
VQAEGVELGDELALSASGVTAAASGVAIVPNTFGAQRTLVVLVNFQDLATQPYTPQTAYSVTFTTTSNFYRSSSFQQTWWEGDVAGWFTLPISSASCDTASIQNYARQAAQAAGYVLANYSHLVYAFPQVGACSWWGLSNVGGSPSNSWINGSYQLKVVGHELGHAIGLYHSHSLSCGTAVYAATGCSSSEYGDTLDIMGNPTSDDFTAAQKERLGWLNSGTQPPIAAVSASGTYLLGPYEAQDAQVKALKIAGPNGTSYYLESRQALGVDSSLVGNVNVLGGILLHNFTPGNANSSYLLNATPGGSWNAPALAAGASYTDAAAGVKITPVSVAPSGASVQVEMTAPVCAHANPSLSLQGPSQPVTPGAAASFAVTVVNNDPPACGASAFDMASTVPSGWTAFYAGSVANLAPGASAAVTLQVTAPGGTPDGTYTVLASAGNSAAPGYSATASASATVYTPPPPVAVTVTVATGQPSYRAGETVQIRVTVTAGSAPLSGEIVTAVLTRPNGKAARLSGTTGAAGVAVLNYASRKNDPKGVWQVRATSAGVSATASFTLQ